MIVKVREAWIKAKYVERRFAVPSNERARTSAIARKEHLLARQRNSVISGLHDYLIKIVTLIDYDIIFSLCRSSSYVNVKEANVMKAWDNVSEELDLTGEISHKRLSSCGSDSNMYKKHVFFSKSDEQMKLPGMELIDPREYRAFCFRGEGRANFVISAKNTKTGLRIVWRFAKARKSGMITVKAKSEMVNEYMERMVVPFFDEKYLVSPKIIEMKIDDVYQLAKVHSDETALDCMLFNSTLFPNEQATVDDLLTAVCFLCIETSFRPKKVLILSKITRYEFEKRVHKDVQENQLEALLKRRGSDYSRLLSKHQIHHAYLKTIQDELQSEGYMCLMRKLKRRRCKVFEVKVNLPSQDKEVVSDICARFNQQLIFDPDLPPCTYLFAKSYLFIFLIHFLRSVIFR
uniref:Inositol-pentakisphosphate 2-kinase n=1 Tax=Heterorhabditis bacteriophora TaxID=37862 RepID=A0A1I7WBV1_HETBA